MKISPCFNSLFLLLLVLLCSATTLTLARNTKNYITWNDFRVHPNHRDINRESNGRHNQTSRVIVVDHKGGGDAKTVQGAVDLVPEHNKERVKIHILPGIYREKVKIPSTKPYISFIGDENNPKKTIITGHDKAGDLDNRRRRVGTRNSATVMVKSDYFVASGITFENTVVQDNRVKDSQAVAFAISGDKAMFYKVRFLGSQDTLFDLKGSHYFYQCYIRGVVDFIFGRAKSLYQECTIEVGDNAYVIAAHKRDSPDEDTGFSFLNCTVIGGKNENILLGRPWAAYAKIIYSYCDFNVNVRRGGWSDWGDASKQKTAVFGEYDCTGKGADKNGRADWVKDLNDKTARPFLSTDYINEHKWLRLDY